MRRWAITCSQICTTAWGGRRTPRPRRKRDGNSKERRREVDGETNDDSKGTQDREGAGRGKALEGHACLAACLAACPAACPAEAAERRRRKAAERRRWKAAERRRWKAAERRRWKAAERRRWKAAERRRRKAAERRRRAKEGGRAEGAESTSHRQHAQH